VEVPLGQIRRGLGRRVASRRDEVPSAHALQLRGAHQPRYALAADPDPLGGKLRVAAARHTCRATPDESFRSCALSSTSAHARGDSGRLRQA